MKIMAFVACALVLLAQPLHAYAYVGPGLGAGMVAAVLGVAGGLLMLIVGVFWYPIKKVIKRFRKK
jgi:hypothetical protein